MKNLCLSLFLFLNFAAFAQYSYPEPRINPNDPSLPDWVQEMYSENPDVYKVDRLRNQYFEQNNKQHDVYTRWYKRWRRYIAPFVTDNGRILIPSATERLQEASIINKSSSRDVGSWNYLGPKNHVNVKFDNNDSHVLISDHSNVYCFERCTSNPTVFYCGTESGGVYKSIDAGQNWTYVTKGLSVESVTAISVDPTNPDIVVFSAADEIWRSSNGGTTWSIVGNTAFQALNIEVYQFNWHPTNNQIIYAGTNLGLYRSTDNGLNWSQVFNGECMSVEFKPGNPQIMYALRYNPVTQIADFYKSNDGGNTFTIRPQGWFQVPAADAGLIESRGGRIAVTLDNPERVYVLLVGSSEAAAQLQLRGTIGVYSSSNGGESWSFPHVLQGMPYNQETHPNLMDFDGQSSDYNQIYYNTAFACSQLDETRLLIGGLNLWRSEDGGATYTPVGGYLGDLPLMHVDLQEFKVFKTSETTEEFWFSSDGGINLSSDWAASHDSKTSGLGAVNFWGMDQGWNDDIIVGGRYHNGNAASNSLYGTGNFLSLGGGESATGYVNYSPERKTFFSDQDGITIPEQFDGIATRFSVDLFPNESYFDNASSRIMFDPFYWNIAYLGKDNVLYKSTDGGSSYAPLYTFGSNPADQVFWMEQCPSSPNVFYVQQVVSNVSRLYKSTDGGLTFSQIVLPQSRREMYFSVHHENPDILWIAFTSGSNGNKVYRSDNAGGSWTNITTAALNGQSIKAIAHQAGTNNGIYVACRRGPMFYRDAVAVDWLQVGTDMPAASYPLRILPFYKKNKLRLGMWNIGVWENDLQTSSSVIPGFSSNYRNYTCPGDTIWFTDHSVSPLEATLQWSFPGGTPTSSTARSPKVVYNNTGSYSVSLTVTYNGISETITRDVFIESLPGNSSALTENFEQGVLQAGWRLFDDGNDGDVWRVTDLASSGSVGNGSLFFDNFYQDVQGKRDQLITANYIVSSQQDVSLSFDVAYSRYNSTYSDSLAVYFSEDCGETKQLIYLKGGQELATAPDFTANLWVPEADQWRNEVVVNLPLNYTGDLSIIFENRGRYGQPIYLDNLLLEYSTNLESEDPISIKVYPVPTNDLLHIEIQSFQQAVSFRMLDLTGRIVKSGQLNQGDNIIPINDLSSGVFFIEVDEAGKRFTQKIIMQ
jgi:photosystem II stability/assembly factor-like uncharacterized protein